MMRRFAAVAASTALVLALSGAATAYADATPAQLVTVSGPVTVQDVSEEDHALWEASASLECPEGSVAVAGGVDLAQPWELMGTWAEGRHWTASTYVVGKSDAPQDIEAGDSAGTAHAVCLVTS